MAHNLDTFSIMCKTLPEGELMFMIKHL